MEGEVFLGTTLLGYCKFLLPGFWITIELSAIVLVLSLFIGGLLGILYVYGPRWLRYIISLYTWLARGIPLLVILFLVYYGFPMLGIDIDRMVAATLALTFFGAANLAESFKAAILSVRKSYVEGAHSVGMTFRHMLVRIVFPLMLPFLLPSIVGDFINLLKDSTLVSLISVMDLMMRGQMLVSQTFDAFTIYFVICGFYYVSCLVLEVAGRKLELRYNVLR